MAGVWFLGSRQLAASPSVRGFGGALSIHSIHTAPAAQRFVGTLRSPGSLFCYVVKGKQLHKSLNLHAARGVASTPPVGPEIT